MFREMSQEISRNFPRDFLRNFLNIIIEHGEMEQDTVGRIISLTLHKKFTYIVFFLEKKGSPFNGFYAA